jgi:hypothetical protein
MSRDNAAFELRLQPLGDLPEMQELPQIGFDPQDDRQP